MNEISMGNVRLLKGGANELDGSNIFLIATLVQAASLKTTYSNPSQDTSVTYLLWPGCAAAMIREIERDGCCIAIGGFLWSGDVMYSKVLQGYRT